MITEEQRQKVLKALRDSYANLTAERTTEKEFENIIEAMEIVKNLTITDVSQQRELLIALLKYYENKPLTIGLEEPELLVDKFLAINGG